MTKVFAALLSDETNFNSQGSAGKKLGALEC